MLAIYWTPGTLLFTCAILFNPCNKPVMWRWFLKLWVEKISKWNVTWILRPIFLPCTSTEIILLMVKLNTQVRKLLWIYAKYISHFQSIPFFPLPFIKSFNGSSFLNLFLFIYFWLCWVFISVRGLSLVAASGDHSSSRCAGLSLLWPLVAKHRLQTRRLSSCGSRA